MFSPGREEEERARAGADEAYTSQLREWQADDGEGDEVRTGWPDGRSHGPNRKFGRYFEPLGFVIDASKAQILGFWRYFFLEHSYRSPEKKTFFDSAKCRLFEDDTGAKKYNFKHVFSFLFSRRMGRGA